MTQNKKEPTALEKFKQKLEVLRTARQKILDERYDDMSEYLETEEERHNRIMNDDNAWQ